MIRRDILKIIFKYANLEKWAKTHLTGLFVFNVAISMLVLLNTAQYFKPYLYLGINMIFLLAIVLSVILLGVRAKVLFLVSIAFLIFAGMLKIVRVDLWADRASIYFFQSFVAGIALLLIDALVI